MRYSPLPRHDYWRWVEESRTRGELGATGIYPFLEGKDFKAKGGDGLALSTFLVCLYGFLKLLLVLVVCIHDRPSVPVLCRF